MTSSLTYSISIIIPAYNEEESIHLVLEEIPKHLINQNYEIIVIDDGSIDNTSHIVQNYNNVKLLKHSENLGKGTALRTGFDQSIGEILLIQDADMEYHPKDIPKLVFPILSGKADVVYGSRFKENDIKMSMSMSHKIGNKVLSLATRILYGFQTTDMETGYKVFKRELINNVTLRANSFNIEPELTAIFSKRKARYSEVAIDYNYRKTGIAKITWIDGIIALWWLIKMKFKKID
ncbi:MAG: glycosyltransferase family 2 protein [Candidatus Heimdallarchaeota archaeon]|nr:glycosyltransferase family 2 protein [Candidatus Heimdallarchaeota archaeon]